MEDSNKESSNGIGRIVSIILVSIVNYILLKLVSDELKRKNITRWQAFGYIYLCSAALMLLSILVFFILKFMGYTLK